jgi:tripartite-type tricarboxylate transporter receptor subunit TctC
VPGYEAGNYLAFFAPAKTPSAIINQLNQAAVSWLRRPDITKTFADLGAQIIASSPAELEKAMKADMAKWGKIIKDEGIHGGG